VRNLKKTKRNNNRIHHGKEKQRRKNDSGKTTRGEGAGRKRDGQESSRRPKNHEHLSTGLAKAFDDQEKKAGRRGRTGIMASRRKGEPPGLT